MAVAWTEDMENMVLRLRDEEKKTYREIAEQIGWGVTVSGVKHKYVRLKQTDNDDKYHHPKEKIEQVRRVLEGESTGDNIRMIVEQNTSYSSAFILEAHAGWGNLTPIYTEYGFVVAQDIQKDKVDYLREQFDSKVRPKKCDSHEEIYRQVANKETFDVVDLDPYGYPSRFFPHVFHLIEDGYLFVTFPKVGVQQMNKITVRHLQALWDIHPGDTEYQEEKVHKKMKDYGFFSFRSVEHVDTLDMGRMFRFAYRVKKEPATKLVGLEVNR